MPNYKTSVYAKSFNQLLIAFLTLAILIIFNSSSAKAGIIGDLFNDGIRSLADQVSKAFKPHRDCPTLQQLQERYAMCFSCMTMKVLLESFMTACSKTYHITREAGLQLLKIGSALWIAFTIIKYVSSLTNVEGASMMNELLKFCFKVLVAYVFITAGISALVGFFINPVLGAGADFANVFLEVGLPSPTENPPTYVYAGPSDIISADVLNKIMAFTEGLSRRVAINMVIGNGLICFSFNAGLQFFYLTIPDIWLWICGAAIWFVGLLLSMFVSYYLLDIAFKIGFAIMALPIVIGLWPFPVTSKKFSVCFSIILKAAATYAFLAMIVSFSMVMIDQAIGGVEELFNAFQADDLMYVEKKFSITEAPFLIFCVCFFYAVKLIGANQQYTNKFFPDQMFKNTSPMNDSAVLITNRIKAQAMKPLTLAKDIAVHQTGRAAGGLTKGVMNVVTGKGYQQGQSMVGNTAKAGGKAVQGAGNAAQASGAVMSGAGRIATATGKGMQALGKGMQAIPVVGNIAGAVVGGIGTVTAGAGRAVTKAGQAVKQTGKSIKQVGKGVEKVGENIKEEAKKGPQTSAEAKEIEKKKKEQEEKKKSEEETKE